MVCVIILSTLLCLRLYVVCFCLSRESHNVLCSSPAMPSEKRVHGWTFSPNNPLCSPYDSLEGSSLCLCGTPKPHSEPCSKNVLHESSVGQGERLPEQPHGVHPALSLFHCVSSSDQLKLDATLRPSNLLLTASVPLTVKGCCGLLTSSWSLFWFPSFCRCWRVCSLLHRRGFCFSDVNPVTRLISTLNETEDDSAIRSLNDDGVILGGHNHVIIGWRVSGRSNSLLVFLCWVSQRPGFPSSPPVVLQSVSPGSSYWWELGCQGLSACLCVLLNFSPRNILSQICS